MVAPTRAHLVKTWQVQNAIRIPQQMLKQVGLVSVVELAADRQRVVIQPLARARRPRQGWAKSFKKMAKLGDDRLLDAPLPTLTKWDETEWQW